MTTSICADGTRTSCPACGSPDCEIAFDEQAWAARVAQVADTRRGRAALIAGDRRLSFERMLRCRSCGTLFACRIPDAAALHDFYQTYDGNDGYQRKLARKVGLETRRIFLLKWLVRGRRFLDVGCNVGAAVEGARRNGFTATGLEIDAAAVAIARSAFPGNAFVCGNLDALPADGRFDLVYCTEVLEHVPDPAAFARALAGVVAPGGVLFLTTPDAGHRSVRNALLDWAEVKPPEHLTLFTKRGVRALLRPDFTSFRFLPNAKPGVQVIARRSSGAPTELSA